METIVSIKYFQVSKIRILAYKKNVWNISVKQLQVAKGNGHMIYLAAVIKNMKSVTGKRPVSLWF